MEKLRVAIVIRECYIRVIFLFTIFWWLTCNCENVYEWLRVGKEKIHLFQLAF